MIRYSLVIPCFNELENIKIIIDRLKNIDLDNDFELIIVNNGSTDETHKFISCVIDSYNFLKYINIKKNIGYGHGIIEGLNSAKGKIIGWTHADLQTDIYDGLKGFDYFKNNEIKDNLFVKGLRKNRKFDENILTIGMSIISSIFLRNFLWDINAQPNLFYKSFFKSWKNPPLDFSLDLYVLYKVKKQNLKIKRFPVKFKNRIFGSSKWNTSYLSKIKFISRNLTYILKLAFQNK